MIELCKTNKNKTEIEIAESTALARRRYFKSIIGNSYKWGGKSLVLKDLIGDYVLWGDGRKTLISCTFIHNGGLILM